MNWQLNYEPPQMALWTGRSDSLPNERFFQITQCIDLKQGIPSSVKQQFALLGFCCDEGVRRNMGRLGAKEGPKHFRQQFANLALTTESPAIFYDVGNITCDDEDLEKAQAALAEVINLLLQHGLHPIVIGGGHEIAWGHYQGIAKFAPQTTIGIINFDAHFDLRPLKNQQGHSGSPFLQIAQARKAQHLNFSYLCLGIQQFANTTSLFKMAQELQTEFIFAEELHRKPTEFFYPLLDNFFAKHDVIYLTVCLDVFAAAIAPGVSAPQVLGLFPSQVLPLIRHIMLSKKVLSVDIAELAPNLDNHAVTAKLAAGVAASILNCTK